MAHWAVVVPAERYEVERLFARDAVECPAPGAADAGAPGRGDLVLLITEGPEPLLFGLGRVEHPGTVMYTHRLLDEPVPADDLLPATTPGSHPLSPATFEAWAGKVGADHRVDATKRTWLVSVDLPIEASGAAEAVRAFWSYVYELGPRELPAFVAPSDDELAMQAFVLGVETNQDPEEDD
jgi:hypothetical protein